MSSLYNQEKKCTPYDPRVIANYLLDWGDEHNQSITQLKLLKLYYFCYGYYLVEKRRPLAKNDLEAWKYGPVSRSIRKAFSSFEATEIDERAYILNIFSGEKYIAAVEQIANPDRRFIDRILEVYGNYQATTLSNITHEEGSPWDVIWNGKDKRARIGLRITDNDILSHFELAYCN